MNIAFVSLSDIRSVEDRTLYSDVLKVFTESGHEVTVFKPSRDERNNSCCPNSILNIIKVPTSKWAFSKNKIKRGLGQILLEYQFLASAISHRKLHFDLVVCATPTIFFSSIVKYLKTRNSAYVYLLLKDMWPYDLIYDGILAKTGWKGIAYSFLEHKAATLYKLSDFIGCMSAANVKFLLECDPSIDKQKIEITPNSAIARALKITKESKEELLNAYNIPNDKILCVYGGTLGTAQDVPFIVECMKEAIPYDEFHFVIVGRGEQEEYIKRYCTENKNATYIPWLEKRQYEKIVASCDIGLAFLNYRGNYPNYPSRILTYMQASIPIILATDVYTDVGHDAVQNEFGLWSTSDNTDSVIKNLLVLKDKALRERYGNNGFKCLSTIFSAERTVKNILSHISF